MKNPHGQRFRSDEHAIRASRHLEDQWIVNLGIGQPLKIAEVLFPNHNVHLHSENGLLGFKCLSDLDEPDWTLVNAAKQPVMDFNNSSYFGSVEAFGMIRGGHIDAAVVGALQVDEYGKVANWALPGGAILGVGGAMDLMEGAKNIIVMMSHVDRDGRPKLVRECNLPLTSTRSASLIVTDLATFDVGTDGLTLIELAPGVDCDRVRSVTEARHQIDLR